MTGSIATERCLEFINTQAQMPKHAGSADRTAPSRRIVTISRQAGSGAHAVSDELVRRLEAQAPAGSLPWKVFDRDLVHKVLEEHDLPERMASFMPEDRISAMSDTLDELFGFRPSSWTLVRQTAETILHLAELGNVVLIGRAGNLITGTLPNAVHVRLVGSPERRIRRVQSYLHLDPKAAAAYVQDEDLGRKRYVEKYYSNDIDDPLLYDLMINTDRITYGDAARLIADAVSDRSGSAARLAGARWPRRPVRV